MVEYLDYQIPVTQLKGPKGNGDMKAARRDCGLWAPCTQRKFVTRICHALAVY